MEEEQEQLTLKTWLETWQYIIDRTSDLNNRVSVLCSKFPDHELDRFYPTVAESITENLLSMCADLDSLIHTSQLIRDYIEPLVFVDEPAVTKLSTVLNS